MTLRQLELTDGFTVSRLTPASGGQNNVVFFGLSPAAEEVVAKVEGAAGRLHAEYRALSWAARHGVAVPRVYRWGEVRSGELQGARCLVLGRVRGRRPVTPFDWRRMGTCLAGLTRLPVAGSGVRLVGADEAVAHHEHATAMLVAQLPSAHAAVVQRVAAEVPVPPLSRPVFAHGDPGPGNFLVSDAGPDHLIDWETAQATPMGLDPARAAVLALLNADPAGGDLARRQAAAVWHGYAAGTGRQPGAVATRWWLTVACVQFLAGRWRRRDAARVRPWEDAVTVLEDLEHVDHPWAARRPV
ncbi:phosphotransferase family protein [Streptomyces montanisoli]|uniref:Aminoglycoside phosphotransferase family protein n=1 Tax=Streptomyces montanisoli TaxID=2798581 RepID=A0A940MEX0_9ACTN|nr:aminoglycoside phosphotransferase family protein [Streptomyces montanisoli]MBP0458750.1 aminoglycoside phosphotransferase family protein [Streptomyces montanisoli]